MLTGSIVFHVLLYNINVSDYIYLGLVMQCVIQPQNYTVDDRIEK